MTVLSVIAAGCASAQTDFKPYSTTSTRAPVVARAVEVKESDLKALAAAGAVIVGTVTTRGNGFAGAEYVAAAAAEEAARHGGTHVVLGMSLLASARGQRLASSGGAQQPGSAAAGAYYPGQTIELTSLVLRLPDDANWYSLPPQLRPERAAHPPPAAVAVRPKPPAPSAPPAEPAETATAATAARPILPAPPSAATAEPIDIDGSHIAPLAPSGE